MSTLESLNFCTDETFLNFIKRVYYNTATFKQTQYIDRDLNQTSRAISTNSSTPFKQACRFCYFFPFFLASWSGLKNIIRKNIYFVTTGTVISMLSMDKMDTKSSKHKP